MLNPQLSIRSAISEQTNQSQSESTQTFKLMEKARSTSFLQWNSLNLDSIPHLKSLILTSVNMLLVLSLFWAHKCRIFRPRRKRHPCVIQDLKQINSGGYLVLTLIAHTIYCMINKKGCKDFKRDFYSGKKQTAQWQVCCSSVFLNTVFLSK